MVDEEDKARITLSAIRQFLGGFGEDLLVLQSSLPGTTINLLAEERTTSREQWGDIICRRPCRGLLGRCYLLSGGENEAVVFIVIGECWWRRGQFRECSRHWTCARSWNKQILPVIRTDFGLGWVDGGGRPVVLRSKMRTIATDDLPI